MTTLLTGKKAHVILQTTFNMKRSKYTVYQDFEWAVKLNRLTLDFIGLWPKTAQSPRQKLMCNFRVFIVLLGVMFGIVIPSIHSLIRISGDLMLMIDNLEFTLPAISCTIRIGIFWWKKEAIIPIMNMIAEDWAKSTNVQDRKIMIRHAQNARIIIICAYCIMGLAFFFSIVLPTFGISIRLTPNITDPGRPMPLQSYYIYDVTKRPQYELTFISQAIGIVLAIMSYSGIDNFLGLLIFHICGQMDILKNRLTYLDKYINSHIILKSCVTKHINLLRAIEIIEDTYNITLLALFVYFAIHFAFLGFRIINIFDEVNDLSLTNLVFFVSMIFNIFGHMCVYCALGEFLVAKCDAMYYGAYSNEWYSVDPKLARNLLFLFMRGAKPIYLTAGKMFPITMATFCNLIIFGVFYGISRYRVQWAGAISATRKSERMEEVWEASGNDEATMRSI
ncbi:PREDICTED: odorant receptor 43a-like [Vollenhovia emeryi]|uniref:odorant receptor 43a-like n=1 Tax=Vollenhovia emeryi TaxID=411798 RepID=UPI0005F4D348|nr:PREDICTED: odorant receptor 43a-like [Vollenhovia emeryi]